VTLNFTKWPRETLSTIFCLKEHLLWTSIPGTRFRKYEPGQTHQWLYSPRNKKKYIGFYIYYMISWAKQRSLKSIHHTLRLLENFSQFVIFSYFDKIKTVINPNCPLRIRVRIDPPHPLVCRKRRLNGGGPSDETGKTEVPCHSRCGTIKIRRSLFKGPERRA
jgi:hypothetical protein